MSVTGDAAGEPVKAGVALVDVITGLHASLGILAALRHRDATGEGQHVEVNLLSSLLSAMVNQASAFAVAGVVPGRMGNAHPSIAPYETFPAADRPIAIAVGNDRQFAALCELAGAPEFAADPRFARNSARVDNRDALLEFLRPLIAMRSNGAWLEAMRGAEIPCGEVRGIGVALAAPETLARDMVQTVPHPTAGEVALVASPLKLSATPVVAPVAPPLLGQDGDAVLATLGYTTEQIEGLRVQGAIG
jgi:crotonobetainyl-CoA:carnitine CoA-transferase CaiB-like acyl-CoA transferase